MFLAKTKSYPQFVFVECSVNPHLLIVNSVLIIGKIQIEQHMTTLSEAVTRLQLEPVAKRTDDPKPSRDEDRTLKFDVGEFTGTNDVDAYMIGKKPWKGISSIRRPVTHER